MSFEKFLIFHRSIDKTIESFPSFFLHVFSTQEKNIICAVYGLGWVSSAIKREIYEEASTSKSCLERNTVNNSWATDEAHDRFSYSKRLFTRRIVRLGHGTETMLRLILNR